MANYGAVELHPWTSRADDVAPADVGVHRHRPRPGDLLRRRAGARPAASATALDHLGVVGQPKVTGKRGIQIWVPIDRRTTFADTRAWVEALSRAVGATVPELVSWQWRTVRSRGPGPTRLHAERHQRRWWRRTAHAAAPGAPVSVPITWDELDDPDLRPDRWTIATMPERLATVGDLFAPLLDIEQDLPRL